MTPIQFNYNITVLMSVYNTPFELIKRAIDSVLNQDYKDFELIILDDGSDIDVQHQIINYAVHHENKITYLRHKNRSQATSINRGVLLSNSNYITIIDADDEYKTNHLSKCLEEIKMYDLIATTSETIVTDPSDFYVPDRHDYNKLIHVDDCIYERAQQLYSVQKVDLRTYIYYRNNKESLTGKIKTQSQIGN